MKIAFIVSSTIDTNQGRGQNFPYSLNRSVFTPEERLRQTQGTLNSLHLIDPTSDIFLIDTSEKSNLYKKELLYVPNLTYVNLNELDPETGEIGRNNPSKGFGETTATTTFLKNYYHTLKNYDFIIKITGRYFFSKFNKNILTAENKDKYVIGPVRKFPWNNKWNYPNFLIHDDKLHWVPTWAYGVGGSKFDDYVQNYQTILEFYKNNTEIAPYMDLECLFYEYMIKNNSAIEAPWTVHGWNGVSGKFFTE